MSQAEIHDTADYFDHPYFKLRRALTMRQRQRCNDVFQRLSAVVEINRLRGQPMLDVGCDTGAFLRAAKEAFGIVPFGIDVNKKAVETALHDGVEAYAATLEDAPEELKNFPLVTAIDLIEHVPDPELFLYQLLKRVRPGGLVYIETPNIRSMVYRFGQLFSTITGGRPAGLFERLFPPQHVQYFTVQSFRALAERTGFNVVQLGCRTLPSSDIAASLLAKIPIGALQLCDLLKGTRILIWAILRRPLKV
jgi:SAM-dependent methyltransferase